MCHKSASTQSLESARRIYRCPLDFFGNGKNKKNKRNTHDNKRKHIAGFVRPKKDEELARNQRERLQQLLTVYGEQSLNTFRKAVSVKSTSLPPIYSKRSTPKQSTRQLTAKLELPKLNVEDSYMKKNTTRNTEIQLPDIKEWPLHLLYRPLGNRIVFVQFLIFLVFIMIKVN